MGGIGFARPLAMALVVMDRNGDLAMATEEQAVRCVFEDEGDVINFDGPSMTAL